MLLIALAYLFSLSFRSWPLSDLPKQHWKVYVLAAAASVLLLSFPAQVAPGILIDMRSVPAVFTTLAYGGPAGLLVSIPMLIYRVFLGGAGVNSGILSHLLTLAVAWLIRPRYVGKRPPTAQLIWPALLIFLPNGSPLLLLPEGAKVFTQAYPLLLLLNVSGFLLAHSILRDRINLLQLQETLRMQAQRDQLTGLYNRRRFDADLPSWPPGGSIIMADIDHFKAVNDELGHAAGDLALVHVAHLLQGLSPASAQIYRYGGEEFVLFYPPQAAGNIKASAEALRCGVAAAPFTYGSAGERRLITVSLGIARIVADPATALQRADEALYAAKEQGRNCTVLAASEL